MEDRTTAADRARSRGVTEPWRTTNRLLSILIALFVLSSSTGAAAFYIVFHRISDAAETAYVTQCESNNETRKGALAGLDKTVDRSKASLGPLLANPATTPEQKAAAVRNYNALKSFVDGEHKSLPQKSCAYPPLGSTSLPKTSSSP